MPEVKNSNFKSQTELYLMITLQIVKKKLRTETKVTSSKCFFTSTDSQKLKDIHCKKWEREAAIPDILAQNRTKMGTIKIIPD